MKIVNLTFMPCTHLQHHQGAEDMSQAFVRQLRYLYQRYHGSRMTADKEGALKSIIDLVRVVGGPGPLGAMLPPDPVHGLVEALRNNGITPYKARYVQGRHVEFVEVTS